MIAKHHGTFQKWVDKKVDQEFARLQGVKAPQQKPEVKLTPKAKAQMKAKAKKLIDEMF